MPESGIAATPPPPYYAVVFTSLRSAHDPDGYDAMAAKMADLAARQPSYLGIESARSAEGLGITVSYWKDEHSVRAWKNVAAHLGAQRLGKERWYAEYHVRICRVERAYEFESPARDAADAAPLKPLSKSLEKNP